MKLSHKQFHDFITSQANYDKTNGLGDDNLTRPSSISYSSIEGIIFTPIGVELRKTVFDNVIFTNVNFTEMLFYDCSFSHCTFTHCDFNQAIFYNCSITKSYFDDCHFGNTSFRNHSNLRQIDITKSVVNNFTCFAAVPCQLSSVHFIDCRIENTVCEYGMTFERCVIDPSCPREYFPTPFPSDGDFVAYAPYRGGRNGILKVIVNAENVTDWFDREFTVSKALIIDKLDPNGETKRKEEADNGIWINETACFLTLNEAMETFNDDISFEDSMSRYSNPYESWPQYARKEENSNETFCF